MTFYNGTIRYQNGIKGRHKDNSLYIYLVLRLFKIEYLQKTVSLSKYNNSIVAESREQNKIQDKANNSRLQLGLTGPSSGVSV